MGYYFSPGHTWIKIGDNSMVHMGIDDFATRLLGQFDTLSAPLMGRKLIKGETAVTLARGGHRVSFPRLPIQTGGSSPFTARI